MQDYYEINVSRNGQHIFATSERSLPTREKAESVYETITQLFRKEDGWDATVIHWRASGEEVRFEPSPEPHQVSAPSGEPWCIRCNRPQSLHSPITGTCPGAGDPWQTFKEVK